jgi:ribosomal protein S27AE
MEEKKISSFLDRLKENAEKQKHYGVETEENEAKTNSLNCINCGAGRTKHDGITHCGYCGFEFIKVKLTGGIY